MSAWLCSEEHISAIVNHGGGSVAEFKMLLKENIRSLSARYPGRDFLNEWKRDARKYMFRSNVAVSFTQVVKCCDSFDYQACETDDYRETKAAAYVEKVRAAAIAAGGKSEGAEYDRAEWSL
jgi:hypothetical protein